MSRCLWENRRMMGHDYTWEITINIEKELSPAQIKETWTNVCRRLRRQGIIALWVREPSRSNHCNYHLIVRNRINQSVLEAAIKYAMPSREHLPYHKHVQTVQSQWYYCRYITKAKTHGTIDGRHVDDKYSDKRILFAPKLGLQKIGTIGAFWELPRKQIWQAVIDTEKRIADGLEKPNIRRLVDHVHSWMPGESRETLERSIGFYAESAAIKDWANSLSESLMNTEDHEVIASNDAFLADSEDNTLVKVLRKSGKNPSLTTGKLIARFWAYIKRVYDVLLGWCSFNS